MKVEANRLSNCSLNLKKHDVFLVPFFLLNETILRIVISNILLKLIYIIIFPPLAHSAGGGWGPPPAKILFLAGGGEITIIQI